MAYASPHYPADEAALLESACAGDENAFAALLERHRCGLELCCYLMLGDPDAARHAVADAAVSAWEERTLVEPNASVRMWLYRVAVRICCEAGGDPISFESDDRLTS